MSDLNFYFLKIRLDVFSISQMFINFYVPRIQKLQYKVRIHSHIYQIRLHTLNQLAHNKTYSPKRYQVNQENCNCSLIYINFYLLCMHTLMPRCMYVCLRTT